MDDLELFKDLPQVEVKDFSSPYAMGTYVDGGDCYVCRLVRVYDDTEPGRSEEVVIMKDDPRLIVGHISYFARDAVFCYEKVAVVHGGVLEDSEIVTGYTYVINN